mmetsp:Transcript_47597/g.86007  ORF Transcript_47597/g.86007 Transcript_47597/m.86007 type:complete len:248 (+) Transcript_47597:72-815(+)
MMVESLQILVEPPVFRGLVCQRAFERREICPVEGLYLIDLLFTLHGSACKSHPIDTDCPLRGETQPCKIGSEWKWISCYSRAHTNHAIRSNCTILMDNCPNADIGMVHHTHIPSKLNVHGEHHTVFQQAIVRNVRVPHYVAAVANLRFCICLRALMRTTSCIDAHAVSKHIVIPNDNAPCRRWSRVVVLRSKAHDHLCVELVPVSKNCLPGSYGCDAAVRPDPVVGSNANSTRATQRTMGIYNSART